LHINALSIYQQKTKSTKYQLSVTGNTPVMAVGHRILHTIDPMTVTRPFEDDQPLGAAPGHRVI